MLLLDHPYLSNISHTRDSVSSGYPNIENRIKNITHIGVFFGEIPGVWIANETLSRAFDMSFQSKQKRRS